MISNLKGLIGRRVQVLLVHDNGRVIGKLQSVDYTSGDLVLEESGKQTVYRLTAVVSVVAWE